MSPDNSVVASYIPLIAYALEPVAPTTRTAAFAGTCCFRSFSAFAFISAISRSALAFISDVDALTRSACSFASRSASALIPFATCSAWVLIAAISAVAASLTAAEGSLDATDTDIKVLPTPLSSSRSSCSCAACSALIFACFSLSSAADMSRLAATPQVTPTEGWQPRSWRIFNKGSDATASFCSAVRKGLG